MEEKYRNILHAGRKGWGRGLPTRVPNLFPPTVSELYGPCNSLQVL